MNGTYQPLPLGSEDYFQKYAEIINEEIEKSVRKSAKQFAQQAVSSFGQMPYGSSATQQIIGDIYGGGEKAKGRAYTGIALGAALPQYQAGVQISESQKQRDWQAEQNKLMRDLQEWITKIGYELGIETAGAGKKEWWETALETGATILPWLL